ncbi:MAG: DoxX family protein [Elusimicrobia bacterium]|nr:DoxX family protein [Elusimicrobiota bacterium]
MIGRKIFNTERLESLGPYAFFPLRLTLAAIFFAHGSQKLFGWFDGAGFAQTMINFKEHLGFPSVLALSAMLAEFVGSLMLLVGLGTRIAAFFLAVVMLVAMLKVHWPWGFFLNWFSFSGRGHGIEYPLALLGACLSLVAGGAGKPSLDHLLCRNKRGERKT